MNEPRYDTKPDAYLFDLPDAIYWPFKRLPESKLDVYAAACVETALKYSEDAQQIYSRVVQSWELSGCQALIGDFAQCKQNTRTYLDNRAKAVVMNEPLPSWSKSWKDVITKAEGNTDFNKLRKCAGYFIVKAFNRKIDLDNYAPKVLPGKSPNLTQAIVSHSLLDYLSEKPELRGPEVIPNSELTEFHWFCRTLASNPTTRMSRQVRRKIMRTVQRKDFNLHHYSKILDDAEKWYKSRVNPGTIENYVSELARQSIYVDRSNIETAIAPCDEATGYPRKWRK